MRHLFAALPVPLLLAACACAAPPAPQVAPAGGQSFEAALGVICDVDRLAALRPDADPLGVGNKRSAFLAQHADNPDAIELRTLMSVKGPADQAQMLREQAKAHGVARCALAEELEKSGMGGLSP
jgi:hypothetical protein